MADDANTHTYTHAHTHKHRAADYRHLSTTIQQTQPQQSSAKVLLHLSRRRLTAAAARPLVPLCLLLFGSESSPLRSIVLRCQSIRQTRPLSHCVRTAADASIRMCIASNGGRRSTAPSASSGQRPASTAADVSHARERYRVGGRAASRHRLAGCSIFADPASSVRSRPC